MNIYKDLIIKEFKIIPTPLTHCNSIRTTPYRYRINLPSIINQNYILKILNDDKEVLFSRKFILYEDLASVPVQRVEYWATSSRNIILTLVLILVQSIFKPIENIKVLLFKTEK
jgi:hypothetical protein